MASSAVKLLLLTVMLLALILGLKFLGVELPGIWEKSFEHELQEMRAIWEQDLGNTYPHAAFERVLELPADKLERMRSSLEPFVTGNHAEATKALAKTYIALIDVAKRWQEARSVKASLDALEGFDCSHLQIYKQANDAYKKFLDAKRVYIKQVNGFVTRFSKEAALIGMKRLDPSMEKETLAYNQMNAMYELFSGWCEA
jgi:hypothetical protein